MRTRLWWVLLALPLAAVAQLAPLDPDWKESDAPPPPALKTTGLIPIELTGTELSFGIDPRSITLGEDDVVRYVVIARSRSGAINGLYEGIRCNTGDVKTYARHTPSGGWVAVRDSQWRSLYDGAATRHSLAIARSGVCSGRAPNRSVDRIVRDLQLPMEDRYESGGR